MELTQALQIAYEHGQFWDPDFPGLHDVTQDDIPKLAASGPTTRQALQSLSRSYFVDYSKAVLELHGRKPWFDGELGDAMSNLLFDRTTWCAVPNFAPPPDARFHFDDPHLQEVCEQMQRDAQLPAIGTGNWKGCHNVGDFHSAAIEVNTRGIGDHLKGVFGDVLANVERAYAEIGLLFLFIEDGRNMLTGDQFSGNINIGFSFVQRSNGWIGLAIIGENQTCQSEIWCRYLATYRPSDTVREWTTLIKHELGHNCGRGHTRGGVMNPSIVPGLPTEWVDRDPSTPWLKKQFGGEPVNEKPKESWIKPNVLRVMDGSRVIGQCKVVPVSDKILPADGFSIRDSFVAINGDKEHKFEIGRATDTV